MKTINYITSTVFFLFLFNVSSVAEDTIIDNFGRSASGTFVGCIENQVLFIQSNQKDTLVFMIPNIDKLELSDGRIFSSSELKKLSENWNDQTQIYINDSLKYSQDNAILYEPKYPLIKFIEYYRDSVSPNIFYFKMTFGLLSNKDQVIEVLKYWCNKVAYDYGYLYYSVEDLQHVDEVFLSYNIFTVQFYKSEIINPCEDPIFQTIREKQLEELSEREFEYYKIKSKECDEYNNRLVLKQGQEKQKKQSKERNKLLWLLVLVIWIPYYLSTF